MSLIYCKECVYFHEEFKRCFLNPPVVVGMEPEVDSENMEVWEKVVWDRPTVSENDFCSHARSFICEE